MECEKCRKKNVTFGKYQTKKIGIHHCTPCIVKLKIYWCSYCEEIKEKDHFCKTQLSRAEKGNVSVCKRCFKDKSLKKKYNLSIDQFEKKKEEQKKCEMCLVSLLDIKEKDICFDHNHKTEVVRDLLCSSCNKGLGHFKENPIALINTLKYLVKHNQLSYKEIMNFMNESFSEELNVSIVEKSNENEFSFLSPIKSKSNSNDDEEEEESIDNVILDFKKESNDGQEVNLKRNGSKKEKQSDRSEEEVNKSKVVNGKSIESQSDKNGTNDDGANDDGANDDGANDDSANDDSANDDSANDDGTNDDGPNDDDDNDDGSKTVNGKQNKNQKNQSKKKK